MSLYRTLICRNDVISNTYTIDTYAIYIYLKIIHYIL
jgi:hypothetical protein